MPSSHTYQLNEIMELVILTEPKSILDIGCGNGKYGLLCHERLNLWDTDDLKNRKVVIDAIEGFPEYITQVHQFVYNKIYIDTVFEAFKNINKKYDLILLIDVLEHFDKEEGKKLINLCLRYAKNLIISTPKNIGNQGECFGNPLEAHKSQWNETDFHEFGSYCAINNHLSYIIFKGEKWQKIIRESYYFKEGWRYEDSSFNR